MLNLFVTLQSSHSGNFFCRLFCISYSDNPYHLQIGKIYLSLQSMPFVSVFLHYCTAWVILLWFSVLKYERIQSFTIKYNDRCKFVKLRKFCSIPGSQKVFMMNECWILPNNFSVSWYHLVFSPINMVDCIDWHSLLEQFYWVIIHVPCINSPA